ncbi:MAG: hypothetical protein JW973_13525 [Bacteroidales bacterium]|nr:hypothetical protein [Bacteroidales bacterium]
MKKAVYIASLIAMSISFQHCREEPEEIIPEPIVLTATTENVTAYGGHDGNINLTVTGGTPPYVFSWSNNQHTEDIDSLTAGTYIVSVCDANHVIQTDTFRITQPAPDSMILTITGQDVSVFGGNDGSALALVSGGVQPYQYSWSNGSSDKEITRLVSGMYYLVVTDSEGSSVNDSIFIAQPDVDAVIVTYTVTSPSETGAKDGSVDVTITGGYPPYNCSWSEGSDQEDLFNLGTGSYVLTVTDQKDQKVVITVNVSDRVTDFDGNSYAFVKIGEQTWMRENMKVTHSPAGEDIVCYAYNNDSNHVAVFGRLYTWDVAMNHSTAEQTQGICPDGWHVPSDGEYKVLEMFLGMSQAEADMENTWRGDSVGTKLIIGGSSGYDARLAGRRSSGGSYSLLGVFEYMWTSTEYGSYAWRRCLDINSPLCGRWNTFPKSYAFSVRCIKNTK